MQRGAYQQPCSTPKKSLMENGTVTQKDQKPSPRTLLDGWPRGPILGPVKHIGGLESSPLVNNVKH